MVSGAQVVAQVVARVAGIRWSQSVVRLQVAAGRRLGVVGGRVERTVHWKAGRLLRSVDAGSNRTAEDSRCSAATTATERARSKTSTRCPAAQVLSQQVLAPQQQTHACRRLDWSAMTSRALQVVGQVFGDVAWRFDDR